jgi:hypothetical protein
VVDVAIHLGLDVGRDHRAFGHGGGQPEAEVARAGAHVGDGLVAGQAERRDHGVWTLPARPVRPLEKGDVFLDIVEWAEVRRVHAMLGQRAFDGRRRRILRWLCLVRDRRRRCWRRRRRPMIVTAGGERCH